MDPVPPVEIPDLRIAFVNWDGDSIIADLYGAGEFHTVTLTYKNFFMLRTANARLVDWCRNGTRVMLTRDGTQVSLQDMRGVRR